MGEPGGFFTPEALCAHMAARNMTGGGRMERGSSYSLLGVVKIG